MSDKPTGGAAFSSKEDLPDYLTDPDPWIMPKCSEDEMILTADELPAPIITIGLTPEETKSVSKFFKEEGKQ